jgi:tyrosyl-tRNA synthetase
MSKSLNNYIGINEPPKEIFGKTMSIDDDIMFKYYELTTDIPMDEVNQMKEDMQTGKIHPKDIKVRLAKELCAQ